MYHIEIQYSRADMPDYHTTDGFERTKREVIRFIAEETGLSQREIASEVSTKDDSLIKRDNLGWRAKVFYVTGKEV